MRPTYDSSSGSWLILHKDDDSLTEHHAVLKTTRDRDHELVFTINKCFIHPGKKGRRKARKTDASDLTPNPVKLRSIGEQLQKLNAAIDGMGPVNDLPAPARARSRKEKNKLASRYQRVHPAAPPHQSHSSGGGGEGEGLATVQRLRRRLRGFTSNLSDF